MITAREGLAIGTLIFYFPALFVASFVAFKHGFGRQAGWYFLIVLSLCRIVGSICGIVSESRPSTGAITAFVVLSGVGLSLLLLTVLALLKRVHQEMAGGPSIQPRIFNLLALAPIAGTVLAIVGGSEHASTTDPSQVAHAQTLTRAAIIVFLVVFILLVAVTIYTFFSLRSIMAGERRILYAVAFSIPFLFVRLLYSLIGNLNDGTNFSLSTGNVVIQACMATLEEFIVVTLYLTAGVLAPSLKRSRGQPA